jgi:hypothetical protein
VLTRAPGLALVAVASAAAAAGVPLHRRWQPARRVVTAAGVGVGSLVGSAGGSAIWFYLRNRSLTGAVHDQALFGFTPQDHVLELLRSPAYALRLYDGLWVWTRFNLPRVPTLPGLVAVPRAVGPLALAGLAGATLAHVLTVAAWAGFVTALRGRRPEGLPDLLGALADLLDAAGVRWPWLVLALASALLIGALALPALALIEPRIPERPRSTGLEAYAMTARRR